MRTCPRCRIVNPDMAEQCDCGFSFLLQSGGTEPVPMDARAIPAVVKVHAILVGVFLGLDAWACLTGRARAPMSRSGDALLGLGLVTVTLAVLFFLMLGGKAWARIALGVITLPAGLLILLPQSAREFTDRYYSAESAAGRRILR